MVDPVGLEAKDSRGRIKPYLRHRLWVDGSLSEDLPFKRLSRLFGVNHYIVSMINPLAVPFLRKDPKTTPDSIAKSMRSLYFHGLKETIKTARRWSVPGQRNRMDAMLGTAYRLMNQDYSGDINIVMNPSQIRARHMLFEYEDEEEIQGLIRAGQRACWPRLDRIRIATAVSGVVDELLEEMEQEAITSKHAPRKAHMTL
jgi:NTE family protein